MDWGTLIGGISIGASVGGAIVAAVMEHYSDKRAAAMNDTIAMYTDAVRYVVTQLTNLRRNCFITNERGHRVKYRNASPERRAMAEAE